MVSAIWGVLIPGSPSRSAMVREIFRMRAGLQIKELDALVGVTEDIVINWELKGMRPNKKEVRERVTSQ